jgi:hypothetical protein
MVRKARGRAAILAAATLVPACGDGSAPFALPDGCYYAEDGIPILQVQGDEGLILTPDPAPSYGYVYTPVRRIHLRPRINRDGAYLEVTPGFYLTDPRHSAARSSEVTGRFTIDARGGRVSILMKTETYGAIPVTPGRPCNGMTRSLNRR